MDLTIPPSRLLEQSLDYPGTFALKSAALTDGELKDLASTQDVKISEIRAPLSLITPPTLFFFASVHGASLYSLNLQNTKIDGPMLQSLSELLPNLRSLSLQYLHDISDSHVRDVVVKCTQLHEIHFSQNRKLSKNLFFFLLSQSRSFSVISLDLANNFPMPDNFVFSASIKELLLIGPAFNDQDSLVFSKAHPDKLELSLTKFKSEGIRELLVNCEHSQHVITIIINELFQKRLKELHKNLLTVHSTRLFEFKKEPTSLTIILKPLKLIEFGI